MHSGGDPFLKPLPAAPPKSQRRRPGIRNFARPRGSQGAPVPSAKPIRPLCGRELFVLHACSLVDRLAEEQTPGTRGLGVGREGQLRPTQSDLHAPPAVPIRSSEAMLGRVGKATLPFYRSMGNYDVRWISRGCLHIATWAIVMSGGLEGTAFLPQHGTVKLMSG